MITNWPYFNELSGFVIESLWLTFSVGEESLPADDGTGNRAEAATMQWYQHLIDHHWGPLSSNYALFDEGEARNAFRKHVSVYWGSPIAAERWLDRVIAQCASRAVYGSDLVLHVHREHGVWIDWASIRTARQWFREEWCAAQLPYWCWHSCLGYGKPTSPNLPPTSEWSSFSVLDDELPSDSLRSRAEAATMQWYRHLVDHCWGPYSSDYDSFDEEEARNAFHKHVGVYWNTSAAAERWLNRVIAQCATTKNYRHEIIRRVHHERGVWIDWADLELVRKWFREEWRSMYRREIVIDVKDELRNNKQGGAKTDMIDTAQQLHQPIRCSPHVGIELATFVSAHLQTMPSALPQSLDTQILTPALGIQLVKGHQPDKSSSKPNQQHFCRRSPRTLADVPTKERNHSPRIEVRRRPPTRLPHTAARAPIAIRTLVWTASTQRALPTMFRAKYVFYLTRTRQHGLALIAHVHNASKRRRRASSNGFDACLQVHRLVL